MRLDVVGKQFHCGCERGHSTCSIIRKPTSRTQIILGLSKIRSEFYSSFKFPDRILKEALHSKRKAKVGMCFGDIRVKLNRFAKLDNRLIGLLFLQQRDTFVDVLASATLRCFLAVRAD